MGLALCLAFLPLNYSNAQTVNPTTGTVSTTGNLITPTGWTGITYTNSNGVGQCCSGGPQPAMNQDTNTIRFSWGYSTAAQSIAASNYALATAGVNIKITGYNYSWTIDNEGNTQGNLTGNVTLVGAAGNKLESYSYNYNNTNLNFQTFSGTQNFTTNYDLSSVKELDVSFTGSDNRFWAGYYGPRVRDVSLSVNYTAGAAPPPTAPAIPTVPAAATQAIAAATVTATTTTTTNTTTATTVALVTTGIPVATGSISSDPSVASTSSVNAGGVNLSATGTVSAPTGVPAVVTTAQSSSSVSQSSVSTISSTTTTTKTTVASKPSATALAVATNAVAATKSVEKSAVQTANAQLATSIATSQATADAAVATINSISSASSQNSQKQISNSPQTNSENTTKQTTQSSTQFSQTLTQPLQNVVTKQIDMSIGATNTNQLTQVDYSITTLITPKPTSVVSMTTNTQPEPIQIAAITPVYQPQVQQVANTIKIDNKQQDTTQMSFTPPTVSVSRGFSAIEQTQKITLDAAITEQKNETVKPNVTQNDLAGSVNIASISTQPQGYDAYTTSTLADARFYEVKEIYKKQEVVDNRRALRSLSSDVKWQQMVDEQFKIGE